MVDDGKYCIDIITQSSAIRSALSVVEDLILENHLSEHIIHQMRQEQEKKAVEEIISVFKKSKKNNMKNKNKTTIIALLSLIVGLLLGYFFGATAMLHRGLFSNDTMYEEMEEHMYGDKIISGDGAMIHVMDEMMLGFRGKTGEAYEKAFLRGMIVHHIGAVRMAEELLEQTDRPELRTFAQDIITAQSKETEIMKGWLEVWFSNEN